MSVTLRPMTARDLATVGRWLREPHVARWWTEDPDDEIDGYQRCLTGQEPTRALMVECSGAPVGWCQWYVWHDYPGAGNYGARPGEIGIDYAVGEPSQLGRGVGTAAIAGLVEEVRRERVGAPFLVSVDATNLASRRVLEKNGFELSELRAVAGEPEPISALYRLAGR